MTHYYKGRLGISTNTEEKCVKTSHYLSLVLDLPPVVQGLVCRLAVPPEDAAQVAVGDGEAHHGDDVGHQEEHDLRTGCNDVSVKVCVTW